MANDGKVDIKLDVGHQGESTIALMKGNVVNPNTTRKGMKLSGDITAPFEFFITKRDNVMKENRLEWYDGRAFYNLTDMAVILNPVTGKITFYEDIHSACDSNVVEGELRMNPHLEKLGIISGKTYTPLELSSTLRKNRFLFSSREECMTLIAKLEGFRTKIETEILQTNDNRGNKSAVFVQNNMTTHDLSFTLECQVFMGRPKLKFQVDIFYDVRDKAISMTLESIELLEIVKDEFTDAVDAEEKKFRDAGVTTIRTY